MQHGGWTLGPKGSSFEDESSRVQVVRVCVCVCVSHWVDVDEQPVLLLCGFQAEHEVQQHRVGVVEVRMRDEDRRV